MNCLVGLPCVPKDARSREVEVSRRMMKARNKQIDKGIHLLIRLGSNPPLKNIKTIWDLIFYCLHFILEIQIQLQRRQKEHKILLLGCGKAGKSTFIKQMRIIHSIQFSQKERIEYRNTIASNIATTLFTLIEHADWTLGGKRHSQGDKQSPEFIRALEVRRLGVLKHVLSVL